MPISYYANEEQLFRLSHDVLHKEVGIGLQQCCIDYFNIFSAFCRQRYGSDDGECACLKSKMVMVSKGRIIMAVLKSDPVFAMY